MIDMVCGLLSDLEAGQILAGVRVGVERGSKREDAVLHGQVVWLLLQSRGRLNEPRNLGKDVLNRCHLITIPQQIINGYISSPHTTRSSISPLPHTRPARNCYESVPKRSPECPNATLSTVRLRCHSQYCHFGSLACTGSDSDGL